MALAVPPQDIYGNTRRRRVPNINLEIDASVFCPKLFPLLEDYSHRFEGYKGSAGSGKSYFITQKIIYRCLKEPIKVLVCRRYASTLRNTCFALFKEVLASWHITPYVKIRETDFHIQFPNGSEIIFTGLDEETKILSLANISTIFVEEVFEVPQSIFEQLNLRMRGKAKGQQIIFAFNPISKNHWLYDFCVTNPPASFYFSETTYKDNPFLNQDYIDSLEELKNRNPMKYNIFALGNWGVDGEGLVFRNFRIEEFDALALASSGLENRVGSDLGYVDPTTIVCSLYDKANGRVYVYDEFYKSGCQLDEVAQAMRNMNLGKTKIYMDSAEPRSIEYFRRQGFNTVPCIKGRDSVSAGFSFLQNLEIIIHPSCVNVIREFENLSYIKDKHTEKFTENMTHEFSHAIDGLRYAYSDIYQNKQLKTLNKALLGL